VYQLRWSSVDGSHVLDGDPPHEAVGRVRKGTVMGVDHAAGGSGPVDARSRVLVRVATVGLVAVLISVTGGAIWAAAAVDAAVQEIEQISGQGASYPAPLQPIA
jgi:hypothetical protein